MRNRVLLALFAVVALIAISYALIPQSIASASKDAGVNTGSPVVTGEVSGAALKSEKKTGDSCCPLTGNK